MIMCKYSSFESFYRRCSPRTRKERAYSSIRKL